MQKKWASLRARLNFAVRKNEQLGEGESDVRPDSVSCDPITSNLFFPKSFFLLDLIIRKVEDGNRPKCGVSDSNLSDFTAEKKSSLRGAKWSGITDDSVMKVARKVVKPVENKLTFIDGTEKNAARSLTLQRTLACDSITALISLERNMMKKISDAKRPENEDSLAVLRGLLGQVRTHLDTLHGDG